MGACLSNACPQLLSQAVALGGLLWGMKVCLSYLDPYREQREQVGFMQGLCLPMPTGHACLVNAHTCTCMRLQVCYRPDRFAS